VLPRRHDVNLDAAARYDPERGHAQAAALTAVRACWVSRSVRVFIRGQWRRERFCRWSDFRIDCVGMKPLSLKLKRRSAHDGLIM
jgi:hypothetical protein